MRSFKKLFIWSLRILGVYIGNSLSMYGQQSCLVAAYPFEGNADDVSGNSIHGIVYGPTLSTDRFGKSNASYLFDGTDDYIEISHSNQYNFDYSDEFTVSLWAKPALQQKGVTTNARNILISKYYDQGPNTIGFPFSIRINNYATSRHGKISAFRKDLASCGPNKPEVLSTSRINDNQWHCITMVTRNDKIEIYIDGSLENIVQDVTYCSTQNNDPLYVGRQWNNTNAGHFYGIIDDIQIFNCALNEQEIDSVCQHRIDTSNTKPTDTTQNPSDTTSNSGPDSTSNDTITGGAGNQGNIVYYNNCQLFIPNAFTPNGDGLNDEFGLEYHCKPELFELNIFNRWGDLVFETHDIDFIWKGIFHGQPCPQGMYVYRLRVDFNTREGIKSNEKFGKVILIR